MGHNYRCYELAFATIAFRTQEDPGDLKKETEFWGKARKFLKNYTDISVRFLSPIFRRKRRRGYIALAVIGMEVSDLELRSADRATVERIRRDFAYVKATRLFPK